ncbi:hypothetical protein IWQ62_002799 [Dispira parvispora]|uniref:PH domain-containing protein n=1 Tax=Dispira parvispora TaxID=1520584 RepID=A0A9W8AQK6_9FUNG|nr:hypothetical protein IWQ62_002799 [Dispira parvispora]
MSRSPRQSGGTVSDLALQKFQLVEALRSGWTTSSTLTSQTRRSSEAGAIPAQVTPLHLAIQFATKPTVEATLELQAPELLNCQDTFGWTALHHASKTGRAEIVRLLLARAGVDDSIADHEGRDPVKVAKTLEVADIIRHDRTEFVARASARMHEYTLAGDISALDQLMDNVRFQRWVDINSPNPDNSGNTVIHEAVETKNYELVKWWCSRGVDVFVRNEQGKLPMDLTSDVRTLKVLEHAPVASLRPTSPGKAPRLQGSLLKWTNFASGYRRRYFVLENGALSYYKDKADASNACRGAINLRIAQISFEPKDQTTFEVQGKGSVRYRLRAEHPVEAKRWVMALAQSKQWALDTHETHSTDNLTLSGHQPSMDTPHPMLNSPKERDGAPGHGEPQNETKSTGSQAEDTSASGSDDSAKKVAWKGVSGGPLGRVSIVSSDDEDDGQPHPPHDEAIGLQMNALRAQLVAQEQLFESLPAAIGTPSEEKVLKAFGRSIQELRALVDDVAAMTQDREEYWSQLYRREMERQDTLAESFRTLILEQDQLEKIARTQRRRMKSQTAQAMASPKAAQVSPVAPVQPSQDSLTETTSKDSTVLPTPESREPGSSDEHVQAPNKAVEDHGDNGPLNPPPTTGTLPAAQEQDIVQPLFDDDDDDDDDEDNDLFFDANDVEVLVPEVSDESVFAAGSGHASIAKSYVGYPADGQLRKALHPGSKKKPQISFWSILKNAIGKDLSKISMPVVFNEPTSMLQRMAEDMEYSDLLDMAARHRHSSERILFIAAWAMSNYSSTMGRVAKPFNPLLGETFEYVRPDKEYRYVSEQVSHHPPISACYCESPNYNFFAEVNVKSKFWGKSFEICPLGVSHVELKVPLQFLDPEDPKQPEVVDQEAGRFTEHYSWKKVITSVQGLIAGNPWMEHYGDLTVVNHRTGETCRLTFKQSGWRGNNLYAIEGVSKDEQGQEQWEIAGKWNERLIARRINRTRSDGPLSNNDVTLDSEDVQSIESHSPSKPILLWRATPTPNPPIPFNLTEFAVTLNDFPDDLRPYLCPTDSRLRPDQRAMEIGEYDQASDDKNRLEEKQRAKRRAREADPDAEPWTPRWFTRSIEPDTNEPYWVFNHKYWEEREHVAESVQQGEPVGWNGVEDIF